LRERSFAIWYLTFEESGYNLLVSQDIRFF
jgi:hypothetical protein